MVEASDEPTIDEVTSTRIKSEFFDVSIHWATKDIEVGKGFSAGSISTWEGSGCLLAHHLEGLLIFVLHPMF